MGKVIGTIGKALLSPFATIIDAVGGSKKQAAPAPTPGPIVMPLADDTAVKRAKRRSITEQMNRGGRSSTMLTADSEKLGG